MELTAKHLSPYLPYELFCEVTDKGKKKIAILSGLYLNGEAVFHDIIESQQGFSKIKPILRPLSDLEKFSPAIYKYGYLVNNKMISQMDFIEVQVLIENKFDILNLIGKGLAIPVTETFNPYK